MAINKHFYPSVERCADLKSAITYLVYELNDVGHWDNPNDDWVFYLSPICVAISWKAIVPPEEE